MAAVNRASAPAGARSGILISTPLDGGPVVTHDTVSCIHCGYNWVWQAGSGRRRGWCMKCAGIVCGRPACQQIGCNGGQDRILDNLEAGKPLDHKPIIVSVP